jgi:hypothetical protein
MPREKKPRVPLAFKNANKAWVIAELEKLWQEWLDGKST